MSYYYLGMDISTQSIKCQIIDEELDVVCESRVVYDSDLTHYKTKFGVHTTTSSSSSGNNMTTTTSPGRSSMKLYFVYECRY